MSHGLAETVAVAAAAAVAAAVAVEVAAAAVAAVTTTDADGNTDKESAEPLTTVYPLLLEELLVGTSFACVAVACKQVTSRVVFLSVREALGL